MAHFQSLFRHVCVSKSPICDSTCTNVNIRRLTELPNKRTQISVQCAASVFTSLFRLSGTVFYGEEKHCAHTQPASSHTANSPSPPTINFVLHIFFAFLLACFIFYFTPPFANIKTQTPTMSYQANKRTLPRQAISV